jgi:hypothetical protein
MEPMLGSAIFLPFSPATVMPVPGVGVIEAAGVGVGVVHPANVAPARPIPTTVPLWKDKLSAGLEELYSSERKLLDGTETGSFFITNVTLLSRNLIRGFDLSASIYNVFNAGYADPASREHLQSAIEQDSRSFRLKLTYRF